ncbi:MAG: hypothetical protein NXH85_05085 [Pseudomonadaceae bacterium]|nr:hypothetical protein [Pseudomonadaceae bacterium]
MRNLVVVVLLAGLAYGVAKFSLHHRISVSLDSALVLLPQEVAQVSYGGVSSGLDGRVGITDLVITPAGSQDSLKIASMSVKFPNAWYLFNIEDKMATGDLPKALSWRVDALQMSATADFLKAAESLLLGNPNAKAVLNSANCIDRLTLLPTSSAELGYSDVVVDVEVGYEFDESAGNLRGHATVAQHDAYRVHGSLDFPLQDFTMLALANVQSDPVLHRAAFELQDNGYYGRLRNYCSTRDKLEGEDYLIAQQEWFDRSLASVHIKPDQPMVDSYRAFITHGGTFELKLLPREPLKFEYISLYHPEMVPDLLNIQTDRS